jgi:hypothetical protein
MLLAGSANSDWYLGLTIGFVVVAVVVIVVAVILTYASRISDQAQLANQGLEEVRDGTAPLWEVSRTNSAGVAILNAARAAREAVVATVTGAPSIKAEPARAQPAPDATNENAGSGPPGALAPERYPHLGRGA